MRRRLIAALLFLGGCSTPLFQCLDSTECTADGKQGTCEPNGYCSFPDLECESGQRFGEFAGQLAGKCVPVEDDATGGATSTTSAPGTTSAGATTGPGSSTTPLTTATPSSSTGEATSSTSSSGPLSSSTSTGSVDSCAEVEDGASGVYTTSVGEVYCEMELGGGGWTLAYVASDDGDANWTYNNTGLFTDDAVLGDVDARHRDMKSPAASSLPFTDVLFVHWPSEIWAAYHDVGDGTESFAGFLSGIPMQICGTGPEFSHALSAGSLTDEDPRLCDTRLYFNRADLDGGKICSGPDGNNTYGPCWNASNNNGCEFDDPALSSFGPSEAGGDVEQPGVGFGNALQVNTGAEGAGENYLQLFVR